MEKSKDERIAAEKRRLNGIFRNLDANKKKVVKTLIERAAFITVTLEDLEEEINQDGCTEEYQNGKNQSGIKKSAAADLHISMSKNLSSIIKQLADLAPAAPKKKSRLTGLMNE